VWGSERLNVGRLGVPTRDGLKFHVADLAREVMELFDVAAECSVAHDAVRGRGDSFRWPGCFTWFGGWSRFWVSFEFKPLDLEPVPAGLLPVAGDRK
jgi:hypothetical protein